MRFPQVPLRRWGQIHGGGTPTSALENWDGSVPFVTPPDLRGLDGKEIAAAARTLTEAGAMGSTVAPAGSVMVSTRAPIGYVARLVHPSAFNQGCRAITARSIDQGRFLAYALVSVREELEVLGQGTTFKELSGAQFAGISIPQPPLDEQRVIAEYLDDATTRIGNLIAKQHEMVSLLEERKSAASTQLAWRGVLPFDEYTAGPTDGVPEVPSHWEWTRNKNLLTERPDLSRAGEEELLTVSHITGITPRSEKNVTMIAAESHEGYRLVESGDLVINTMWAWMGALGVSHHDGMVSPAYGVYMPRVGARYEPRYFNLLYRSVPYVSLMTRHSRGVWSSRLRIYPEVFLSLPVVVPPLDEQRAIAARLDTETSKIDALIAKTQEHIALAKERRSALITAAVTGQFDVRTAARKVA